METSPEPFENAPEEVAHPPAPEPLTGAEKAALKVRASRFQPVVRVGHAGVTGAFLRAMDEALTIHELVKIRFALFKDQKKQLAPQIARQTGSELVSRVGNVAIYFRRKTAAPRPMPPPPSGLTPGALD